MARSLSWLDRIVPISRTVRESARSHYDRQGLQRLFELQPRGAPPPHGPRGHNHGGGARRRRRLPA